MEGTCFESDWAAVAAGTSALRALLGRLHQAGSDRLGPMFAELDELKMLTEAAQVGVLDQGLSRGDVRASDAASSAGWVRQWGPSYRAGGAAALVRVAEGVAKPCHGVLREAVLGARVPVRNAAVALGEMDKLLHRLTPACAETVLGGFVAIAESDGPREIRALRPRVIAKYGRLAEFQRREDQLKHGRSLSQPYDDDGMAGVPAAAGPRRPGGAGGDPRPAGRTAALHRARVGPAHQRPAPGGRAGRGLPPRRRRRRVRPGHRQGRGRGHDGLPGPARAHRCRGRR